MADRVEAEIAYLHFVVKTGWMMQSRLLKGQNGETRLYAPELIPAPDEVIATYRARLESIEPTQKAGDERA